MDSPEQEKKTEVRRPMNAFLIFCKRHRSMVREKNPDLDNRSVTRILGDLWANLGETEKSVYTTLAKQYKDAFMKANPDYKWHNPDKTHQTPTKMTTRPTNARVVKTAQDIHLDGTIMPGKLADPSKMGGLSLLLMAGQQSMSPRPGSSESEKRVISPDKISASKSALLELAEMCANELQQEETTESSPKKHTTKSDGIKRIRPMQKKQLWMMGDLQTGGKGRSKSESDSQIGSSDGVRQPIVDILKLVQSVKEHDAALSDLEKSRLVSPKDAAVELFGSAESVQIKKESNQASGLFPNERPAQRVRSWSESAKEDHGKALNDDSSDHSNYTSLKAKDGSRSRRMSQSETIAGCLSDQNDNAIVSCGKAVVDHIVERLLSTDIAQAAMKLKGVPSIDELKALLNEDLAGQKIFEGEGSHVERVDNSGIERLVAEMYEKERMKKETTATEVVKKDYEPILRVPNVKNFLEINESSHKRVASEAFGADDSEVKAKKRQMTLPLEEIKLETVEDSVITPESKGDKSEHDFLCGINDEKERDENGGYQPVRKSRRRNRGQRYLELINEGIIQPSKERLAARRAEQTSEDESLWCYEDMIIEEEIQEVRRPAPKRSGSDSDALEEKKYKTGDFDLEAQIATLPACSLDPVSRGNRLKNAPSKIRHHSDGSCKKTATVTSPTTAVADMTTLALPPHVKLTSEPVTTKPVSGSRKRKARKHSINHLLPVNSRPNEDKLAGMTEVREGETVPVGTSNKDSGNTEPNTIGQVSGDSDQSNSDSRSCDMEKKSTGSTEEVKTEVEQSQYGCEISQSEDSCLAQGLQTSQSERVLHSGSTEKGCDGNANINTTESDVLDFRTSNSSSEISLEMKDSVGREDICDPKPVHHELNRSNNDRDTMQKQPPSMLSGSCNLSEVRNKEDIQTFGFSVDSPKGDNPSQKGDISLQKGDNSSLKEEKSSPMVDKSQSKVSDIGKELEANTTASPSLIDASYNQTLPSSNEEKIDSIPSSSVNIVAFSSASTSSSVELVSLTTTAVTQGVNLDVLADRAEDSPTGSITRSPLAAGSPSVGVVHS